MSSAAYSSSIRELLELASWLYFYNRLPQSRRWMERFPGKSVLQFLAQAILAHRSGKAAPSLLSQ